MTARLPSLKALAVIRALERAARATTVPVHKGRALLRPILGAIIKQAGLTVEEFVDLL